MITRAAFSVAIGLAALSITPAEAADEFFTGNSLIQLCREAELPCVAYFRGTIDAYGFAGASTERPFFCSRPTATMDQHRAVVMKYMDDHPERRDQPASLIVWAALKGAFPCVSR